jgi:hypothetical protein
MGRSPGDLQNYVQVAVNGDIGESDAVALMSHPLEQQIDVSIADEQVAHRHPVDVSR